MKLFLNIILLAFIIMNAFLYYQDLKKNNSKNNWDITLWLMVMPFLAIWIFLHYSFLEGFGQMGSGTWIIIDVIILPLLGLVFKFFVRTLLKFIHSGN